MNVIYRDPASTYPVDSAAPPLADEKMRALIVPVPTATGSTYRSAAYLSKALVHTGPDVLDMFIFRPSAALAATRYLMLFDADSEPAAGARPIVPCWTLAAGQWGVWEPQDGIRLTTGLYIANSSSDVDYQPVIAAAEVDIFARVKVA